jgi:hypothetical protein
MFQFHSFRLATAITMLVVGGAFASDALKADAPSVLEVKVVQVQAPAEPAQGSRDEILYRMEVISVIRSNSGVKPGDTIVVRASTPEDGAATAPMPLADGWMGTAYLRPDSTAGGTDGERQFSIAAEAASFEDMPPGEPSLIYRKWPDGTIE